MVAGDIEIASPSCLPSICCFSSKSASRISGILFLSLFIHSTIYGEFERPSDVASGGLTKTITSNNFNKVPSCTKPLKFLNNWYYTPGQALNPCAFCTFVPPQEARYYTIVGVAIFDSWLSKIATGIKLSSYSNAKCVNNTEVVVDAY
jgi:hypothetical protein